MSACSILTRLDEKILSDASKWTQGIYENYRGQVCLLGGLRKAAGGFGNMDPPVSDFLTARDIVRECIGSDIMSFNDDPRRTFPEVKRVIQEARSRACEEKT